MRNEELGAWLTGFHNLNNADALSNTTTLHRGHVTTSHPQPSTSMCGENNNFIIDDDDNGVDVDVTLSNDFARMSVFHEQGNVGAKARGYGYGYGADDVMDSSFSHTPCSFDAHTYAHAHAHAHVSHERGATSPIWGVTASSSDVKKGHTFGPPMESSSLAQMRNTCYGHVPVNNLFHATSPFATEFHVKNPILMQQPKFAVNVTTPSSHCFPAPKQRGTTRVAVTPNGDFSSSVGFQFDGGFILQEKDMKCCVGYKERLPLPLQAMGEELPQLSISPRVAPTRHEKNGIFAKGIEPTNFSSLVKLQGYFYYLARDQNGCRFLQRMVDEGTSEDVQVVFNGVIDDVVELMTDPFGNYLVQKLLDVCGEDERLQVVSILTKEPRLLVKTSLNIHGTRVVQKLIATVDSSKQIALLRSAILPGFLNLIKDLNGNHVIQRCLQYFSCKDNEFIFYAATKFCVDIATHQHGCCVLQRCIDYSTGKYQEKLIKEICRHGLLLAQDPFGNYVVQYIIEMENPSTSSKLHSQLKGNYANLSMQKFSSHVVEKCLIHLVESRSRIVQELLSFPHFERLLQDPYANYVVQRALGVTKGFLHASLAEAVRPYKTLRTSPYCKRIFSGNLLNK